MSLLGLFKRNAPVPPASQRSTTYQGRQFEIFVEGRLRRAPRSWRDDMFECYYSGVQRNTVFEIIKREKKIYSAQIDICCRLDHFYNFKDKYGLFELKYSNELAITEAAVAQLMRSCCNLERRQSSIQVVPMAVITNKDFTRGAKELAAQHSIRLIDSNELTRMSEDNIDSVIKSINVRDYSTKPNYVHIHV